MIGSFRQAGIRKRDEDARPGEPGDSRSRLMLPGSAALMYLRVQIHVFRAIVGLVPSNRSTRLGIASCWMNVWGE